MVGQAMKHPGNYFYVFPTAESARKALWEKIDRDGKPLLGCIPESKLISKSDHKMLIKVWSGEKGDEESTIRVVGLDWNPDSIRGITPRGIVFSEFAYQDEGVYRTILPALQQFPEAWVIYNSTPQGKNHFYELFQRTSHSPNWLVSFHQVLHPDKPGYLPGLISVEDIRMLQAESGLPDEFIEQEFGCSFEIGAKGSVYAKNMEEVIKQKRIGAYPYNAYKAVDTFWDLGMSDPTVIWFRQMDGKREIYFDYIKLHNHEFKDIIDVLREKGYRYRTHFIPHDGDHIVQQTNLTDAEFVTKLIKEFRVGGSVEVCKKLPKKTSINTLKSLFSMFYFNCPNFESFDKKKQDPVYEGVMDLMNYRFAFDKIRKQYRQDPFDDHTSHSCDALATRVGAMYLDDVDGYNDRDRDKPRVYNDYDPLEGM